MGQHRARGSAAVPVLMTLVALIVAFAFGAYLFVAGAPQRKSWYAAIEIGPGKAVWVQLRGDRIGLAASPEALKKASWVRGKPSRAGVEEYGAWTEWAFITLPLQGKRPQGWEKVEVSFSRGPWSSGYVGVRCRLTRTDAKGSQWTYVMPVPGLTELQVSPKEVTPAVIPGRGEWQMRLSAVAVREGEEGQPSVAASPAISADVMLLVLDGTYTPVMRLLKDGQPVHASLTVRDDAGKVVAKDVSLSYSPGTGSWQSVSVPDTKRSYVCDATLDTGPAAGVLHSNRTVPADAWKALEQQAGPGTRPGTPSMGVGSGGMMRRGGGGRMRMAGS